jgi:hypothetical protein
MLAVGLASVVMALGAIVHHYTNQRWEPSGVDLYAALFVSLCVSAAVAFGLFTAFRHKVLGLAIVAVALVFLVGVMLLLARAFV